MSYLSNFIMINQWVKNAKSLTNDEKVVKMVYVSC